MTLSSLPILVAWTTLFRLRDVSASSKNKKCSLIKYHTLWLLGLLAVANMSSCAYICVGAAGIRGHHDEAGKEQK